jgi:hypothetical protein
MIVVVPVVVVMRMVVRGVAALTGRIGRHSTARLAIVAAASLVVAQLDEGVRHGHPQLGSEGGVVAGPVGKEGSWARSRPRFLTGLWHNANSTTNVVAAPVTGASSTNVALFREVDRTWAAAKSGQLSSLVGLKPSS